MTNDHHAIGEMSVLWGTESPRSARTSDDPMPSAKDAATQKHPSSVAEWDSWKSVRDLA